MADSNPITKDKRENSPWLHRYRELLPEGSRVLDLGCGAGEDSRELAQYGCRVIALDVDMRRMPVRPRPGDALFVAADTVGGLPFRAGTFDVVVASLSLHYFKASDTRRAVRDIHRILKPSGSLLCRVNAVGDVNFGYGDGKEIERSLYQQPDGRLKRFFDEAMLETFLHSSFKLIQIEARSILQRGVHKKTLECVARRR